MTDRTAFIAHDTKLLELLKAVSAARVAADAKLQKALSASTFEHPEHGTLTGLRAGFDRTFSAQTLDEYPRSHRFKDASSVLPVGTVFWQPKTFQRGEGDKFRVVAGHNHGQVWSRIATVDDIPADGEATDAYHAAKVAFLDALDAVQEHEKGYTGWSRFFLVVSSAGHVHSSMHCSTCRPTTEFAPVVALSGADEAEAVALVGSTLCSVCFPSAPIDGEVKKLTKAAANKLVNG